MPSLLTVSLIASRTLSKAAGAIEVWTDAHLHSLVQLEHLDHVVFRKQHLHLQHQRSGSRHKLLDNYHDEQGRRDLPIRSGRSTIWADHQPLSRPQQ